MKLPAHLQALVDQGLLSVPLARGAAWSTQADDGRARWGEDGDRAFSDGTPLPVPPTWDEVEWCDDGGSCEHPECMELEP